MDITLFDFQSTQTQSRMKYLGKQSEIPQLLNKDIWA